ncbi:MAG: invasion associated locus B family protein [Paracoccus sp. (in: a-proteobacteria)]
MSPKFTSTALMAIFVLGATPLLAQTAAPAADAAVQTSAESTQTAPAAADAPAATATPATGEATEGAEPAAATPEDSTTAESTATSGEPQPGAYYVRESHGDWTLRCIKTNEGADPCELYQLLKDSEGNSVAEITLIPLESGGKAAAGATIVTPLETDLTQGVGMKIDSGAVKAYPFNFCAPVGCVSRVGLTGDELGNLKRGNAATIAVLPYGGTEEQVVNLNMSLAGFTAGYSALETAVAELRQAAEAAGASAPAEEAAIPAAQ